MSSGDVDMYFDERNTARPTRGRFRYQDECVAQRCIANLASGEVAAVVVEWSTDYIAILANGDPELVSVKHRDLGTGEWTMSTLGPVLQDLHRVWREMNERCSCAFASSAGVTTKTMRELRSSLGSYIKANASERDRFLGKLALPDPPLPRRSEMTTIGISAMASALSLLGRERRYAEECYQALVDRIERVAVEVPDSADERIARLSGSLKAVTERRRPSIEAQTLRIHELRELVLRTESAKARAVSPPIRAAVVARPLGDREVSVGGRRYRLIGEPEQTEAGNGSYQLLRADARQTTAPSIQVRLSRLEVLTKAAQRRAELEEEAVLHDAVAGLPDVLAREDRLDSFTFVTEMPPGAGLPAVYGRPPYPGVVLDALVRLLPQVTRTLESLHDVGKAHRALRPEVLIASRDRLWLRDAGLATSPATAGEGRAEYRAPEQERPTLIPPGPATDIYQLAAIVYHLATGQPPGQEPLPPTLLRSDLAPELEETLLAALTTNPEDRPGMQKFAELLGVTLQAGGTVRC